MKTGMGLALIGIGAIFAFAVRGDPSFLNLHIAGYVIMIIGILGLAIPRRGYGWVGRRLMVRQARWRPNRQVEEVIYPTTVNRNPACPPRARSAARRRARTSTRLAICPPSRSARARARPKSWRTCMRTEPRRTPAPEP
jgi:hypothetical protein